MPIYGLIDNTNHDVFDSQESYRITVTPNCSLGSGTALAQTLPTAFYTIDFLAGGHGIAFGAPSTQTGFYVNMDANFLQGIDVTGDAAISGNETVGGNAVITGTTETDDVLLDLSDYQTSGSVDKAIYDALVSLGWDSDVIV